MDFNKKTILITGASSGIGKALAEKLSQFSCNLILTARRENLLIQLKQALSKNNAQISILENDVSHKDEVKNTYILINKKQMKIDIAFLNAGVGAHINIEKYDSTIAERIFNTNFMGVIYWIEQLLPNFIDNCSGLIVVTSSLADNRGYPGNGFYCASKSALTIYLESLRNELKQYGIKVITLKPGFVKTPMTEKNKFKMPFIIEADKAADIIIKGVLKGKSVISFPLQAKIGAKIIGVLPEKIFSWFIQKSI